LFSRRRPTDSSAGNIFILTFGLENKPPDFDLSVLSEAWKGWRQEGDDNAA
jgi:hypothetical protein